MSTTDPITGPLAPWQPERAPALANPAGPPAWDDPGYENLGGAAEPPKKFSIKLVLRALRRHWWQILLLWAVASAGAMAAIHAKIKPTYDATAYVRLDPPRRNPIGPDMGNTGNSTPESQLETQALRMLTPDILGVALKDPRVASLPRVRGALDPEVMLRKELKVAPVRGTKFITVVLTSLQSAEAVAIVNAVADAYKATVAAQVGLEIRQQTQQYDTYYKTLQAEVSQKEQELHAIVDTLDGPAGAPLGAPGEGPNALKSFDKREDMTLEEYRAAAQQLSQTEMLVQELEAALKRLQVAQRAGRDTSMVERAVDRELKNDPELANLSSEFAKAQGRQQRANGLIPKGDPAQRALSKQMDELKSRYKTRSAALRPEIRRRLEADDGGAAAKLKDAEEALNSAVTHRDAIRQHMSQLRLAATRSETGRHRSEVDLQLRREDLNYSKELRDRIKQQMDTMTLDLDNSNYRVSVTPAQVSKLPTNDSRKKMLLAAPLAILLGVVGLFTLLELAAGRVGDPDDLQGRLNLGVIGVVPMLPTTTVRSTKGSLPWIDEAGRRRRRTEEFVQSLDHLRVQLWSGRRPGAGHRCVLITSASVSEGKTTLAAQLAGRCANAGLSTLLIDADMRRPALARLLEVPAEPGLADVLAGLTEPESAMTVIGQAGGFYLMPAGRVDQDPGRLLGGPVLASLLARLRETFDIIIVDAPPVLPVPDALILGRHTDGAVLAVRHDASRYPLVERAKQKLASVGVPALGVVVNGVRGGGANYGNYAYSAAAAAGPDGPL